MIRRNEDGYVGGFDIFDSAVVCAESEEDAKLIHPDEHIEKWDGGYTEENSHEWCLSKEVEVSIIGCANKNIKKGVVLSYYAS